MIALEALRSACRRGDVIVRVPECLARTPEVVEVSFPPRNQKGVSSVQAHLAPLATFGARVLWKGVDLSCRRDLFGADGKLGSCDGVQNNGREDFGRDSYWKAERETAVRFAKYAKHLNPDVQVVVLRIEIPAEAFKALQRDVVFVPDWEQ